LVIFKISDEDALMHYGVKGMKWRKTKFDSSSIGSNKITTKDSIATALYKFIQNSKEKIQEAKKKSAEYVPTKEELRQAELKRKEKEAKALARKLENKRRTEAFKVTVKRGAEASAKILQSTAKLGIKVASNVLSGIWNWLNRPPNT
jgi:molecular chaperone DnaK (HSP70)